MMGPVAPNLVIFVADALRLDWMPNCITSRGTFVPTDTDGPHTPSNFPCILSGRPRSDHGVKRISNDDSCQIPTVLDLDQVGLADRAVNRPRESYTTSLWPSHDQAMMRQIFHDPNSIELKGLPEPFVYVERCMATHNVYGRCHEGCGLTKETDPRTYPDGEPYGSAKEYYLRMKNEEVDHEADYQLGVATATARFYEAIRALKEMGVYDDTFIVFTSDHGEAFPEDGYHDVMHRFPCPETMNVGTVFYDREIAVDDGESFASHDIIDHWWPDISESVLPSLAVPSEPLTDADRETVRQDLEDLGYL